MDYPVAVLHVYFILQLPVGYKVIIRIYVSHIAKSHRNYFKYKLLM